MKGVVAIFMLVAATSCAVDRGDLAVPSARTIAKIESGVQVVDNIVAIGGSADATSLNSGTKIKVRNTLCNATGPIRASCSYEATRCPEPNADTDGDGWCTRQSIFVRVDARRDPMDVTANGWGIDR